MGGFLDSGWLKLLEIAGLKAAFIAIGCALILISDDRGWYGIDLDAAHSWFKPVIFIAAVLAACLALAALAKWGANELSKYRQRRNKKAARAEFERQALNFLDTLNSEEREYISFCVKNNQRSFNTVRTDKTATSLEQKGLVVAGRVLSDVLEWPFLIPEFVWNELMKRKDEFTQKSSGKRRRQV